jgi:hypothetical protein
MGVVERFNKKLLALEAAVNATIQFTVNQNKIEIVNEQTEQQMYNQGEDGKGVKLVPSYATSTISKKKSKGQKTSNVTLKDTGAMYNSVVVDALITEMVISVNVNYFQYLQKHYNTQILGLQKPYLKQFVENKVLSNLKKEFKKIIKSK